MLSISALEPNPAGPYQFLEEDVLPDGRAIRLTKNNEYNLIQIEVESGELPKKYLGNYTTRASALQAVTQLKNEMDEAIAKKRTKVSR